MPFLELKKLKLKTVLQTYKKRIDQFISDEFSESETENKLKEASLHALEGAGKRFRPSITLIVAELLQSPSEVLYPALAIELFQTASLIADRYGNMASRVAPSIFSGDPEVTSALIKSLKNI